MTTQSIWDKIKQHEGEIFYTVRGKELVYRVIDDKEIAHNRTSVRISRKDFEKALAIHPQSTASLHDIVTGPSYVYAIITDPRMR